MPQEHWASLHLAQAPGVQLGALQLEPATREVVQGSRRHTLEPRVMQVLVVLAATPGRVVSRDELVARCWAGRVVGDGAINRVISQLRHLAQLLSPDGFTIETIARVGYRLQQRAAPTADACAAAHAAAGTVPSAGEPRPLQQRWLGLAAAGQMPYRRWLLGLGGGAVLAVAAAAVGTWPLRLVSARPGPALATEPGLMRQAQDLLRDGSTHAARQAVAYLQALCQAQPASADAWGLLALAYAGQRDFHGISGPDSLAEFTRAAAARALELAPRQPDAQVALVLLQPLFREWGNLEAACRRLLQSLPDHPALLEGLGRLLMQTGRWSAALPVYERLLALDPLRPSARARQALALWSVGRAVDAERAFEFTLALWPQHALVWQTTLFFRMFSSRYGPALGMLGDATARPHAPDPLPAELGRQAIQALQSGHPGLREAVVAAIRAQRRTGSMGSAPAANILAALGHVDEAFDVLHVYYFGGELNGRTQAAPAPGTMRETAFLFTPPAAPLRASPRFVELTSVLGLERYWRVVGVAPDHRRSQRIGKPAMPGQLPRQG